MLGTKCRYKFEVSGKSRTVWYKVEVPGMQWDLSGTVFAVSGCQGQSVRYKFKGSLKTQTVRYKVEMSGMYWDMSGKIYERYGMSGMNCPA